MYHRQEVILNNLFSDRVTDRSDYSLSLYKWHLLTESQSSTERLIPIENDSQIDNSLQTVSRASLKRLEYIQMQQKDQNILANEPSKMP